VANFFWGPLPVFTLTLRQFTGGKAVRVVGALSLIPVLFAVVFAFDGNPSESIEFLSRAIFQILFVATLLPILVLILGTGAPGNEIEDQTLPYLTLKPISRLRIVIEKLMATIATAFPLSLLGLVISYFVIFRGDSFDSDHLTYLWAMVAATFAGVVAYGSLFMLVSLLISQALLAGIVYTLVWESLLGRYLPGLKLISVRHYSESIYVGLLDTTNYYENVPPDSRFDDPTKLLYSILVVAGICVISVLLSAWRLKNLNLE